MNNFIPYLILIAIFVPLIVWTIVHKREPGLITVFSTYIGMIYFVEFFVLVVFSGYCYKPMVLSVPYYDNILGAVISDLVVVPAIALVVAAFQLKNVWCVVLGILFGGIEWIFISLRVYQLYWWKIAYTIVVFTLFFIFARYWLKKVRECCHPVMHFISLFLPSFMLVATILFVTGVFGLHLDHIGVFAERHRDSVFIASIYGVLEALVFSAFQFWFPNSFKWNVSAVIYSILFEYVLERMWIIDILVRPFVYYAVQLGCSLLVALLLFYMNRWLIQLMRIGMTDNSQ